MTPGWPCNKPDLTMKETTLYSAAMTPESMAHTNIHDPLHVYSIREFPLTQLPVDNTIGTLQSRKAIFRGMHVVVAAGPGILLTNSPG